MHLSTEISQNGDKNQNKVDFMTPKKFESKFKKLYHKNGPGSHNNQAMKNLLLAGGIACQSSQDLNLKNIKTRSNLEFTLTDTQKRTFLNKTQNTLSASKFKAGNSKISKIDKLELSLNNLLNTVGNLKIFFL